MSCDCLNTCGDDPWLKDGRVQPCKNFIKREQQDKLALEKMAKVTKIAELYGAGADFDLVVLLHEKVQRLTAENADYRAIAAGEAELQREPDFFVMRCPDDAKEFLNMDEQSVITTSRDETTWEEYEGWTVTAYYAREETK